jgi:hypothetical protein
MKLRLHMPTVDWNGGAADLGNTLGRVVEAAEEVRYRGRSPGGGWTDPLPTSGHRSG